MKRNKNAVSAGDAEAVGDTGYVRPRMLDLLQDIAESEHHLRHSEPFAELVALAGFEIVKEPHRFVVVDPKAPTEEITA